MTLTTGTKLGPYEIIGAIGAGGMGEVYQARDSRLDRTVAIKVLPSHLSTSEEVKKRFEREARAVSSLNHPNICTLHDIGSEDGVDYLVMEYLEGETLAERIEKGALPLEELLRVATEIADGLDKAHRQGLVHRDLKPGNIMLTKSGAKLLDFGLARAATQHGDGMDLSQSPTLTKPLTAEGAIVGTFQYMGPEQLEGREADARTDIFAFGLVLYEMATGTKAFTGATQASLIASILKEEPRPIAEVHPMSPPALDRVVRRCIAKDPEDRWQTARDLMLELEWLKQAGSQAGTPAPVRSRRKSRERIAWVLAGVLALTAGVLGAQRIAQKTPAPEVLRFTLLPPEATTINVGQPQTMVSPDGRSVVFAGIDSSGTQRLWVRPLASRVSRVLPGTEGGDLPFWSPDSRSIGFFTLSGKLARVSVTGGGPQILCDAESGRGGTWSKDDVIVFAASSGGPLSRVSASGGVVTQVTQLDTTINEEAHRFPQFLPDGRHFLYVSLPAHEGHFQTYAWNLDTNERKAIVKAGGAAVYGEPGYLLFERDQALLAHAFDAASFQLVGTAKPIGEAPGNGGGWTGAPAVSVSRTDVLVHTEGSVLKTQLVWVDNEGRRLGSLPMVDAFYANQRLSPDGTRVAFSAWNRGSTGFDSDIWTVELARGVATRFTFDPSENFLPVWSPDGKKIVFVSDRSGAENLYIKDVDGSGEETPLFEETGLFTKPEDWSPDGKTLVYHTLGPKTGFDIRMLSLADERESRPFLETRFNECDAAISPDGKWIAYRSDESGRWEIYIQSFPGGGNKHRVSTGGAGSYGTGYLCDWVKGGSALVYLSGDNTTVLSATITVNPQVTIGVPRTLYRLPIDNVGVTVTRDGERFLVSVPAKEGLPALLYVMLNWSKALETH